MQEDQIIRRVLQGDTEAFRWIVERYQGPVWQLINRLVGSDVSEDLAQDVFVSAFGPIPLATLIARVDMLYCPSKDWSRFGPLAE